jgi:hypothetical protein
VPFDKDLTTPNESKGIQARLVSLTDANDIKSELEKIGREIKGIASQLANGIRKRQAASRSGKPDSAREWAIEQMKDKIQ